VKYEIEKCIFKFLNDSLAKEKGIYIFACCISFENMTRGTPKWVSGMAKSSPKIFRKNR
jgi:hypothetical protein